MRDKRRGRMAREARPRRETPLHPIARCTPFPRPSRHPVPHPSATGTPKARSRGGRGCRGIFERQRHHDLLNVSANRAEEQRRGGGGGRTEGGPVKRARQARDEHA
eukprot:scaffold8799_cov89-Isochrysis_galbana.AAC.3